MSDITIGEALARRKLKTEMYGVRQQYVPGQHLGSRLGPNDCMLSWVDAEGGLAIVPCERINEEWFHREVMVYCTVDTGSARTLPRQFALTGEMIVAIETGMQRKKTARPPGRQPESEPSQGQESGDPAPGE